MTFFRRDLSAVYQECSTYMLQLYASQIRHRRAPVTHASHARQTRLDRYTVSAYSTVLYRGGEIEAWGLRSRQSSRPL